MNEQHTRNWPELAIGLFDRLTRSNAEIRYEFEKMKVQVPSGTGAGAEHAEWMLNGSLKISTAVKTPPKNKLDSGSRSS